MRTVMPVLAYVIGFWALFQVAGLFSVAPNVSGFYPAPALSIAFIALHGIRYAPAVLVAAALGSFPYHGFWDYAPQEWWQCVRQAVVYSLAGHVLGVRFGGAATVRTSRDVFALLSIAALATLASAAVAVAIFWHFRFFPADALLGVFFSFWAGDAAGVIMALALLHRLLVDLRTRPVRDVARAVTTRPAGFYAKVLLLPTAFAGLGFGALMLGEAGHNYGYLIVLPVVWLAATEGLFGGALAALAANISAAAVYNLAGGQAYPAVEMQTLFAVTAAIGLVVGAAFEERRAAEEARRQKDQAVARLSRAATVGALGSTISHELATPLQTALVNAQLAADLLESGRPDSLDEARTRTARVTSALETAALIHKRIHGFLRGGERVPVPTRLVDALRAAIDLMEGDVRRSGASLDLRLGEADPCVHADPIEIQQVLINLIRNAQQALESVDHERKRIVVALTSGPDGMAAISVEDNGPGLPDGDVDRLFASFHSTKADGLGLGLPICRTIAEGYGGSIMAQDTGRGARFTIRLPVMEASRDA